MAPELAVALWACGRDIRVDALELPAYAHGYCGLCAICAYVVHRILIRTGHPATFCLGSYAGGAGMHCWVEVYGHVVDITATQYDVEEEVYIVPVKSRERREYDLQHADEDALEFVREWGAQSPHEHMDTLEELIWLHQQRVPLASRLREKHEEMPA